ncbi:ATP-binding cassette domain-containing protein [Leptospira idonii]|uniref:ABC transporter ATP-binding protein n=1 Tax=Leptospira idonii TaxID=1193500 RepID=A0A4R9LZV7_9LEPT|nr:ATP-binding cassette domain-containing protein [Leptospira idonii]TGN18489.1 ABC transporter ATP-binding protein [Leptospira idonii]
MNSEENLVRIESADLFTERQTLIWKSLDWNLKKGEIHCLVGESGSGKTTLALSLFGLLPSLWNCEYRLWDVLGHSLEEWSGPWGEKNRGSSLFLVPQNPNLAFHPYRKMGDQMEDFFRLSLRKKVPKEEMQNLWGEMGISHPEEKWDSYAKSLSGGEKQRICLSLAVLGDQRILVLDEPTTGLDAKSEKWVLQNIRKLAKEREKGILFISHDFRIVESMASRITIMKEGKVLETTPVKDKKIEPKSDYGKLLEQTSRIFH